MVQSACVRSGRLMPTSSADVLFAGLALWLGVGRREFVSVMPSLGGCHDLTSYELPIGIVDP
jgi:hypothetical protein